MKVYMIRHAKSMDASNGLAQKDDTPIDISSIPDKLTREFNVDKVYSSPLKRATQTADTLFKEFEILDFIYEYKRPKFLDGKTKEEAETFWETTGLVEYRNDADWSHDQSESFNDVKNRAKKLYELLKSTDYESVAIVSHGLFLRHFIGYATAKEHYDQTISLDALRLIPWDNLEVKIIEI